ncbi:uncharacterized protein [Macrobrachium rosenbergii]|uniref:uncharacterized protein n=1 Tax=Macrobrachium rosenbergii TaxID=79674 RepID=UPI0034D3B6A4
MIRVAAQSVRSPKGSRISSPAKRSCSKSPIRSPKKVRFASKTSTSASGSKPSSVKKGFQKGIALTAEIQALSKKGALEPAPPSPGFYSWIFVAPKAGGSWRPIIDLWGLNRLIVSTKFHMETSQSVLRSVRRDDWMISVDLKDAYLQVPIHQESRKFLCFLGSIWNIPVQSPLLRSDYSTSGFHEGNVSDFGHNASSGFSDEEISQRLVGSGFVCGHGVAGKGFPTELVSNSRSQTLGIRVNLDKSALIPAQVRTYLGMTIQTRLLRAFSTEERILPILSQLEVFLSNRAQPVSLWKSLLGRMSSLSLFVPGSRLQIRSLQVSLRNRWDFREENAFIVWDDSCLKDLRWHSEEHHLTISVRLDSPLPDFHLYTDASDWGWGATLEESQAQGLWRDLDREESINFKELRVVEEVLSCFSDQVSSKTVAMFCNNITPVSYLKKEGGTKSQVLNGIAQRVLCWYENHRVSLIPLFVSGKLNVLADTLSRSQEVLGGKWTLVQEEVQLLLKR